MEIQQLRHFAAVARYGHLGKAADEQKLTQSGITRSIQSLEEFLGVSLLLRTARGVVLTPVGKELVRHAEAIINQREHALEAVQAFMKGDAGTVTIGVTNVCDYFFMPDVTTQLLSEHPRLRLNTTSGAYLDLVESLRMGAIELVVGLIDPSFRHPEIRVEELFVTRSVVACRSQHPLAKKKAHTVQDLSEARWAMPSGRGMQHAFASFFQAHRLPHPDQILQTNSLIFLHKIVQSHDVLTVLPWQLAKADVAAGRLCVIGTETPGDFARIGIALLNAGNLSLAAGIVVNQIRASAEQLRGVLSEDPITEKSA